MSCETCGEVYISEYAKWCKPCQINNFKNKFTDWTSGDEKIDEFIQEMQLKPDKQDDIIFEWISYNQFSGIKEIGKSDFATVYSAIWKDGPFYYDEDNKEYTRKSDRGVALRCLHNSQNINKCLNEVLNSLQI